MTTKKGNKRKGAKMAGSRLAYDDTKQEKMKAKKGKKTNPWLVHLKKVRASAKAKGKSLKEVMIMAKASYKKK